MEMDVVRKMVVYLDYNIFVAAIKSEALLRVLTTLTELDKFVFPFTYVHMHEVNRISDPMEVKRYLDVISAISQDKYLDFNEKINMYTIRPRSPLETFESINEVPKEYVDEVLKISTKNLHTVIPNLPENLYKFEDMFAHFAGEFRKHFPDTGKKINNLSREAALSFLADKIFKLPLDQFHKQLNDILTTSNAKEMPYEYFISVLLTMSGYKTPNSDLKKPDGLLSDEMHLRYASQCQLVISTDQNFRKKLCSIYSAEEKAILDLKQGLALLYKLATGMWPNLGN